MGMLREDAPRPAFDHVGQAAGSGRKQLRSQRFGDRAPDALTHPAVLSPMARCWVLPACYARCMRDAMSTIGQRELRNDSGAVMRGLAEGRSYRITSRGVPVGVLRPADSTALDDVTVRMPRGEMTFPTGLARSENSATILAELRGNR